MLNLEPDRLTIEAEHLADVIALLEWLRENGQLPQERATVEAQHGT